jgi:hypothetical protein
MMQTSSRNTQARQPKSRQKQVNTFAVPTWLQPMLETASLCVLPVTLLILLALIALGFSNAWAHLEPGFSSLLAVERACTGGVA